MRALLNKIHWANVFAIAVFAAGNVYAWVLFFSLIFRGA